MADCSVLVVDDDPSIRETLAEILALEGYPVETATNGAEALRLIARRMPGLILLDMRMPVLDGWGFAERFREEHEQGAAILVMTAAIDARRWAEEIGAEGYLAKPFDLMEALEAVGRFCAGGA
jgi:CheY-like chemotaxis protein